MFGRIHQWTNLNLVPLLWGFMFIRLGVRLCLLLMFTIYGCDRHQRLMMSLFLSALVGMGFPRAFINIKSEKRCPFGCISLLLYQCSCEVWGEKNPMFFDWASAIYWACTPGLWPSHVLLNLTLHSWHRRWDRKNRGEWNWVFSFLHLGAGSGWGCFFPSESQFGSGKKKKKKIVIFRAVLLKKNRMFRDNFKIATLLFPDGSKRGYFWRAPEGKTPNPGRPP